MNIANVIQLVIAIILLCTLIFTIIAIRENTKTQKTALLKEFYLMFFENKMLIDAFYLIKYDEFEYIKDNFHGEKIEGQVDYARVQVTSRTL